MATCPSQTTPAQQKQRGEKNSKVASYKATQLCKFHLMGSCKRQGDCTYAHSIEDLKAPPNFWKTRLCDSFMQTGTCKNGNLCRFAHGKEEMKLAAVLRNQPVKASGSLAPHMPQVYRTPPIPQLSCASSLDSSGMLASMANQPAGKDVLHSWAAIPPPPGLEQLKSPLALNTLLWSDETKIDIPSDVSPCKSPMKIVLGTESLDSMSTASDPSDNGWSSFSSQNTDLGMDALLEMA